MKRFAVVLALALVAGCSGGEGADPAASETGAAEETTDLKPRTVTLTLSGARALTGPNTASASKRAWVASRAASQPAGASSSSSRKAMKSPPARAMPALRALATPAFGSCT